MDRKIVLLMACRDMLIKCRNSYYVISPMETTVFYDDADCDGSCLLDDIEEELEECAANTKEQNGHIAQHRKERNVRIVNVISVLLSNPNAV